MNSFSPMPYPFDSIFDGPLGFRPTMLGKAQCMCIPEGRRDHTGNTAVICSFPRLGVSHFLYLTLQIFYSHLGNYLPGI